jgi:hypothetical protein
MQAWQQPSPRKTKEEPPKVENCAIVTVGTPVLYACKGKVYTGYKLQHLREEAAQDSSAKR